MNSNGQQFKEFISFNQREKERIVLNVSESILFFNDELKTKIIQLISSADKDMGEEIRRRIE